VPAWRTISLRLPTVDEAPAVFSIDRGDGGQPHLRSTLTLGRDGRVVASEAFADLSLGRRIRNLMRFAHTGEVLGVPGQTVAGLVSAGGVVMVWTGLALAWRRFRAWRAKPNQGLRQPVAGTGSVAASVRACQSRFIFRADHRAFHTGVAVMQNRTFAMFLPRVRSSARRKGRGRARLVVLSAAFAGSSNGLWQDSGVPGRDLTKSESEAIAPSMALGIGTPTRSPGNPRSVLVTSNVRF
jgi:hypothetical protein